MAGFVARMPISMVTLGIVLLITAHSGSYGLAGAVSAAYMVATAVAAPVLGRLVDAWGQNRVIPPAVLGFCIGLGGLTVGVEQGWPTPVPHLLAALAGCCYPPIGACVRARWANALGLSPALHTAYSLEAVIDEAIFIIGPVSVTILATDVAEWLGIASVVGFAIVGGGWLAAQRRTQPSPSLTRRRETVKEPLGWRWMTLMVIGAGCLGTLFGSTEVVTVAFAQEHGHRGLSGALLAVWAAGSLIAGLVTGTLPMTSGPLRRYRLGALGMACVMVPLPFVTSIPLLAVVLFLGGFSISPTLVACVSLVQEQVPPARLTEGITWVTTGIGFGVAPGAAVAGRLIDAHGASAGYIVPVAGGALAALAAALTRTHRQQPEPEPTPSAPGRAETGVGVD